MDFVYFNVVIEGARKRDIRKIEKILKDFENAIECNALPHQLSEEQLQEIKDNPISVHVKDFDTDKKVGGNWAGQWDPINNTLSLDLDLGVDVANTLSSTEQPHLTGPN